MRILAVCAVARPGGAEIGLLRLATRLRQRGHEVTLTTPGPGPLDDAGLPVRRVPVGGLAAGAGARALLGGPRLAALARGADLVYLNGTVPGRLLPFVRGGPAILHVHDMVERVPRHWRRARAVLADSHAVARALGGLAVEVVHCPVELDPPPADPPWEPDDRPVVGFVGRIEPRKGPLDLVQAAPALRAARPSLRIVVVGDDPYGTDPDYLARVRHDPDVEHHGWQDGGAGLLRHLDVLVVPSRREPFGTVAAEALAVGTPVVAARVDGLPEVVEDGVTGALVRPGRPEELAAAVLRVLERRAELGARGPAAAARFGADAYADRVEAILERAVAA